MRRHGRMLVVLVAVLAVSTASCRSEEAGSTTVAPGATPGATVSGNITVLAAASLADAFRAVGAAFTKANPGARVTFSFDASSALVQQIVQGAPADLFASADTTNMDKLTQAGLAGATPVVFATNRLAVIVAAGNPKGITGVADLARPDLKVVLCADGVPCGTYAARILDSAEVDVKPVSLEQNVKGVVTKVVAGEADAGIVYVTDVEAAGDKAAAVAIPADHNVVARYPIATVKTSAHAAVDDAFIHFLTGPDGQAILARFGFGAP